MTHPDEILLVGTGNLASHLATLLSGPAGFRVDVAGRDAETTEIFCNTYGGLPFRAEDAKYYQVAIICVSDQAIEQCAGIYAKHAAALIHTSGATPFEVLSKYHSQTGVFWPMQTFTAGRPINWHKLPVCIQASGSGPGVFFEKLSNSTGLLTVETTSAERLNYHLAAVFACNFTNHLYTLADIWCRENLLEPKLMLPLIEETAKKVQLLDPTEAQTGPAKRADQVTIDKHMALLNDHPALRQVYQLFSEQIMSRYHYLWRK